ncbi:helix-turn-helix domain-containing protein [Amycolatopsis sp. H20-H5]|uniref:helix-turn-helix domain-containing protein n=1 Tax=Amycolatopsis sp. H20-H5 TaxID=3046309 RepID=UPI002DB5EE9C|nr:helix-turn-helix transcriptional regulator [Amycolatopsis sp. H20-H5]MEC3982784.1 helix-turn-helix transcriptional regulator [Amycolatopsis sp. H20-H5]
MSIVRRWQLAASVKVLREQANLTQDEAVERLQRGEGNWSRSTMSRVENREHNLKPREVEQLLAAYGIDDADSHEALTQLAIDSRKRDWWHQFQGSLPVAVQPLLSLESGLIAMRDFQNQLIHGLLQTSDYVRALMMSIGPGAFDLGQLERGVAARIARQQILTKDSAPSLHFILDEIVMHHQLRRLLQVTENPNLTIQILPKEAGGSPGLLGPFAVLTLPEPIPDIGYTEGSAGTFYFEDRERVRSWTLRFGMLTERALSRKESAEVITEAIRQYQ